MKLTSELNDFIEKFYETLIHMPSDLPDFFSENAAIYRNGRPQSLESFVKFWSHIKEALSQKELVKADLVVTPEKIIIVHQLLGRNNNNCFGYEDSGLLASGNFIDVIKIYNKRVSSIRTTFDDLGFHQTLAVSRPYFDGEIKLDEATPIANLSRGNFLESIAINKAGEIFVSSLFEGKIYRLIEGQLIPFAELPNSRPGTNNWLSCLVFDNEGHLYASTFSEDEDVNGIWRFSSAEDKQRVAALPPDVAGNGISRDEDGNLYVADSFGGRIWKFWQRTGNIETWFENDLISRRPLTGMYPGVNGLQIQDQTVYVTNSDKALFLQIPINPDGSPGQITTITDGLPGDDFAIRDTAAYITTHPFNQIIKVDFKKKTKTLVANELEGIVGPTACSFGQTSTDKNVLYVVGDGGLREPGRKQILKPAVCALNVN